jgi:hypothetical protein
VGGGGIHCPPRWGNSRSSCRLPSPCQWGRVVFPPLRLGDQPPPSLWLEIVGKVCSSCHVVKNFQINGDEGIFIPYGLPSAASSQEAVEHLDVREVALLDKYIGCLGIPLVLTVICLKLARQETLFALVGCDPRILQACTALVTAGGVGVGAVS